MFRSPRQTEGGSHAQKGIRNDRPILPSSIIASLNRLRPQCPVMLQPINFSFVDSRERALNAFRRLEQQGVAYTKRQPFPVPIVDNSHIEADKRSMVFVSCGHVFGFHEPLTNGVPCPLCRKVGPYVPVAFAFESSICSKKPTHVFNPCGHVASKSTCALWSSIPLPNPGGKHVPPSPKCPFCATDLVCSVTKGGPFNRLIFQGEGPWESDEEDEGQQDGHHIKNNQRNNKNRIGQNTLKEVSNFSQSTSTPPSVVSSTLDCDGNDFTSINGLGVIDSSHVISVESSKSIITTGGRHIQDGEILLHCRPLRFPKLMPSNTGYGDISSSKTEENPDSG